MIVRNFLAWYETAPMHERIEAVQMMAQCTLSGDLGSDSAEEAEAALTLVLDDPAMSVRTALAWELALSTKAPRHLIVGLAHDQAEVAALVLARSPQVTDADLIDCIRHGEALTHLAIASRVAISARVARTLAEIAGVKALCALVDNFGAEIDADSFRIMHQRFSDDGALREALQARSDLPVDVRQSLVVAMSRGLLELISTRGWVAPRRAERTIADALDAETIHLAAEAQDLGRFVAHMAETGQLTSSLLIRSLLTGNTSLFGAALVCLGNVSASRVAGMLRGRGGSALAATCARAGLPRSLVPVFTAALSAIADMGKGFRPDGKSYHRAIITQVTATCLHEDAEDMRPVLAMLRRLDAELARTDARRALDRVKYAPAVETLDNSAVQPVAEDALEASFALETPSVQESLADVPVEAPAEVSLTAAEMAVVVADTFEAAAPADVSHVTDDEIALRLGPAEEYVAGIVAEPKSTDLGADLGANPVFVPANEDIAPAAVAFQSRMSRLIRKPREPERALPPDLEALLADMFRDEALPPPLKVVGEGDAYDQSYFAEPRPARDTSAAA